MGSGASAYLKYDTFKDTTDDLSSKQSSLERTLDDAAHSLKEKLEDVQGKQEELEDLTAQSFIKVRTVLTKSEKEVKALRAEVSYANACLGKMGASVKKTRTGHMTADERVGKAEDAVIALEEKFPPVSARVDDIVEHFNAFKTEIEQRFTKAEDGNTQAQALLQAAVAKHTLAVDTLRTEMAPIFPKLTMEYFGVPQVPPYDYDPPGRG
jgi:DNA repair exonuclease SbcCD ATPase subunit